MPDAHLDTSVIIRFLTGDDEQKQAAALELFGRANAGEMRLTIPLSVVMESVFVLTSRATYELSREEAGAMLADLIAQSGFNVEQRGRVMRALQLFRTENADFGDALIVAAMEAEGATDIYSFDRGFDRYAGVRRLEP